MAERRSMGDALALSQDKLAFIHADKTAATPSRGPEENHADEKLTEAVRAAEAPPASKTDAARRGRKPKAVPSIPEPQLPADPPTGTTFEGFPPYLVSLTTRLSPPTAEALRRAALELRLQRRKPHTQQEIVEAAVLHWLKSNGFLRAA
jgi:hypothetical protein